MPNIEMEYEKTIEPFTSDVIPPTFEELLRYYSKKFSTRKSEKHNKDDERVSRKIRGSFSVSLSDSEESENVAFSAVEDDSFSDSENEFTISVDEDD